MYLCQDSKDAKRKKTDEPTEDDPHAVEEEGDASASKAEESLANASVAAVSKESPDNAESDSAKDIREEEEEKDEQDKETKNDKEEVLLSFIKITLSCFRGLKHLVMIVLLFPFRS